MQVILNQVPASFLAGHSAGCASGFNSARISTCVSRALSVFGGRLWSEVRLRRTRQYHIRLLNVMQALGLDAAMLRVNSEHPDGACIQDPVLFLQIAGTDRYVLILLKPGDPQRFAEVSGLEKELLPLVQQAYAITGDARIEGGDILVPVAVRNPIPKHVAPIKFGYSYGRTSTALRPLLLVGARQRSHYDNARPYTVRTNAAGHRLIRWYAECFGYRYVQVPFHGSLHLTTVCSYIGRRDDVPYVFADPRHVGDDAEAVLDEVGVKVLRLPPHLYGSAWGVNVAYISGKRIVADYPGIPAFLRKEGFAPDSVVRPCRDLEALDTSLTCLLQSMQGPQ